MLEYKFGYKDEFGQEYNFQSTQQISNLECVESSIELLVDEFKNFLLACGYPQNTVNTLSIEVQ